VEAPARPSTTWIAWHLGDLLAQPQELRRELEDLRNRSRIEMSLFDANGHLLASNATVPPAPLGPAEVERLVREPTRFADGTGVVARLDAGRKVAGYTLVKYPLPDLPLGTATAQLLVALGVIAVLSIPLARSVTRPVERLATLTRAFGAGDFTARARTDRNDEIGDLARAFDEMADRIMELRRSEKELLANVSHELRTPLARIRLALELLAGGDTKRAASYVTDIEEDLAELERLLDDVMTTARLDLARGAGGDVLPPLRKEALDGAQLLEAARSRFAIRFPERTLRCSVAKELPVVSADPALLRRVLDNLLDNAAKYSEPADVIELESDASENALVVDVRDHGMGIPPADLERVFEPFFRSDRSRDRATGGVGLGLAVARRIVEAHGGTITAESPRSGGTSFRVTIPAQA
jgi:signal transduction histidine kinase